MVLQLPCPRSQCKLTCVSRPNDMLFRKAGADFQRTCLAAAAEPSPRDVARKTARNRAKELLWRLEGSSCRGCVQAVIADESVNDLDHSRATRSNALVMRDD